MMIKILINTISTKKQAGGAFQISQNFMMRALRDTNVEWYFITSTDVDDAIGEKFAHLRDTKYFVFPTQPDFLGTYRRVKKEIAVLEAKIHPNVVYSVTAPSYFTFKTEEVMRFTNPWVTHPNKYAWSVLSLKNRLFYYLYGLNQKRMMKKAHYFITQTKTCAKGICRVTGELEDNVKVVNNVLPSVFNNMENTPIVEDDWINIACVGNPSPHKNFDILPSVLMELKKIGIENVRFHTTIPLDHPLKASLQLKLNQTNMTENWENHGRVTQKELGSMYRRCQFCFLPTLLEVFSASTVEAMYFNLPAVATDFPFNTDVFTDSCLYYKPKDAQDAARQIAKLITNQPLQEDLKKRMQKQLKMYGDYDAHFYEIKHFLIKVAACTTASESDKLKVNVGGG